ncbi:MAG: hypothetical protein SFX73_27570 [Kofleriaceae bacterium]|nr:hypothetical protein [Kofleriaceae bacterium]
MKRVMLAAVLLGAVGCKDAPSEDQCKQLLDHLVELEFKKGGAAVTDASKADLAKQKADVAKAKPEFIDVCKNKTAKARVECALAATSLEAVAKCDEDSK